MNSLYFTGSCLSLCRAQPGEGGGEGNSNNKTCWESPGLTKVCFFKKCLTVRHLTPAIFFPLFSSSALPPPHPDLSPCSKIIQLMSDRAQTRFKFSFVSLNLILLTRLDSHYLFPEKDWILVKLVYF